MFSLLVCALVLMCELRAAQSMKREDLSKALIGKDRAFLEQWLKLNASGFDFETNEFLEAIRDQYLPEFRSKGAIGRYGALISLEKRKNDTYRRYMHVLVYINSEGLAIGVRSCEFIEAPVGPASPSNDGDAKDATP